MKQKAIAFFAFALFCAVAAAQVPNPAIYIIHKGEFFSFYTIT